MIYTLYASKDVKTPDCDEYVATIQADTLNAAQCAGMLIANALRQDRVYELRASYTTPAALCERLAAVN